MDLMGHIVSALNASRRQWEIKSRPLLALLVEFDRGRYLSESAREEILADINAYTLVSLFTISLSNLLIYVEQGFTTFDCSCRFGS